MLWTNATTWQARHRKPVAFNLYMAEQVSHFWGCPRKRKGKRERGGGGRGAANISCDYICSVCKQLKTSDKPNTMGICGSVPGVS
jgi:hypothetical protein